MRGAQGAELPYNPSPQLPAASATTGAGRGSHLSGPAPPSGRGLLHLCGLQGPERRQSQSLLGNQPWVPLPGMRVCQCWWRLSAKAWGWEDGSGERNAVGCVDTAEGMGVRGRVARNAPRGSVVCLESEAPWLISAVGAGPSPLPSFSSSCLCGHWEGHHQSEHATVCCSCLSVPLPPATCRYFNCGRSNPALA